MARTRPPRPPPAPLTPEEGQARLERARTAQEFNLGIVLGNFWTYLGQRAAKDCKLNLFHEWVDVIALYLWVHEQLLDEDTTLEELVQNNPTVLNYIGKTEDFETILPAVFNAQEKYAPLLACINLAQLEKFQSDLEATYEVLNENVPENKRSSKKRKLHQSYLSSNIQNISALLPFLHDLVKRVDTDGHRLIGMSVSLKFAEVDGDGDESTTVVDVTSVPHLSIPRSSIDLSFLEVGRRERAVVSTFYRENGKLPENVVYLVLSYLY